MLPSKMKAIVYNDKSATVVRDRALPKLRPTYILVQPHSIALNPTDWKHIAGGRASSNCLIGCDYAGTVVEVGPEVTKPFAKGDRIMGCAHGANSSQIEDGVFAEYAVVKGDVQMKVPESMSFEQAATVSLGAITCGQGLYQKALKLNLPTDPVKGTDVEYVLIYGGSSATGALGVQYAKLSGYKVLTTCSPKNFDYVKSLGAEAAFDYNDPKTGQKINEYTSNKLKYAWDTISLESSAKICAEALSSSSASGGCKYGTILPVKSPRGADDVETTTTFMYTMFGEEFEKAGNKTPAIPEDYEFAKMFMALTEKLLAEGKLKPHKETVGKDGLEGALKGLEDMKAGKVSGEKLVYRVGETP